MEKEITIEDIILREEFILTTLRTEEDMCKGCQEEAIKYHVAILEYMCELARLKGEENEIR